MDKLKSRKFWVTFIVAVLVLFAEKLGLDTAHLQELVAMGAAYVIGQGWVDSKAAGVIGEVAAAVKEETEKESDDG